MTSNEIRNKDFAKRFRGVDPDEVEAYLEEVAAAFDQAQQDSNALKLKIAELEGKLHDYTSVEKALQQTFMQAQETSGKAIESARKEAQLIIQEAEMKASQIVEKARTDLISLKEQLTIFKAKKEAIVSRLRMLLNSELDLIKALAIDEEMQTSNREKKDESGSKEQTEIQDIVKSLET